MRGQSRNQILNQIQQHEDQMQAWYHYITCSKILNEANSWANETSTLFIILPSNIDLWDADPVTHTFRLYFLCNVQRCYSLPGLSHHTHISHQGYDLKRSLEFIQLYGDYVLQVLGMIKHGHSDYSTEVPPLDSLEVLWGYDTNAGPLSEITLEPLVDKAITYLRSLLLPKWTIDDPYHPGTDVRDFLEASNNKANGDLCRIFDDSHRGYWMCQSHAYQHLDPEPLEALQSFVGSHGGQVDLQMATIKVVLESMAEAVQFLTLLTDTKHIFNIALKLSWKATRLYLRGFFLGLARTKFITLEIDGITPDIHPEGFVLYSTNLFTNILRSTDLKFVTLINYLDHRRNACTRTSSGCSLIIYHQERASSQT